jgi:hypothetical protein
LYPVFLMGQPVEPELDETRMKRIGKESERQERAKFSLWDKLAYIMLGREEGQERRDYTKRKPNPE